MISNEHDICPEIENFLSNIHIHISILRVSINFLSLIRLNSTEDWVRINKIQYNLIFLWW